ncbi:MAG: AfsR/SARP family transcriptional regulator [Longimicrobiales bacterium]
MHRFRARLFGNIELSRDAGLFRPLLSRPTASLLALLLVNRGHPLLRDNAAAAVWPRRPLEEARKALRTTLWRLGTTLTPERGNDADAVATDREHIRVAEPDQWDVDLWSFEDQLSPLVRDAREIENEAEAVRVATAIDLHRRPFLEGYHDRWCEDRRHRARLTWLSGLEALVRYRRRARQWESVLLEADLVLRVDPLRETMHRELMHAHYARGDRASALRLYERCRALLSEELGVGPMPLTRTLHEHMLNGVPVEKMSELLAG